MALLIDGYNLLHVTGIVGRPGHGLQGAREGLLRFLASALTDAQRTHTTIVFDAADAPPGLPRTTTHEGMSVRYSSDYADADALIEELIASDHVPRSLLVVSSDHRLQRAARRRKARFTDSDVWFADALRRRRQPPRPASTAAKPHVALTPEEIDYWIAEFQDAPAPNQDSAPAPDLDNPFPPGYGEDLLSGGTP